MGENKRLLSIDTLRGFDMMFIMGISNIILGLTNMIPGWEDGWLARQMDHCAWDGLTHHDTIFPLFLFIAGLSFPFSYARQKEKGKSRGEIYCKLIKRTLVLAVLGLIYNDLFQLHLDSLRIFSVLARIGFAWLFAAIIFMNVGKKQTRALIGAAILVGYWLLLRFIPAPDAPGAGPFSYEGNLVGYIDRMLFGNHILTPGEFDPEGLLSLLPAIVTAMLGMSAGEYVKDSEDSGNRKTVVLFAASVILLAAGLLWSLVFPINKALWSNSFVLVVGAYSMAMFALFYWIIDVKGWRKWTRFFEVIGLNSITIYMLQRIGFIWDIKYFFFNGVQALFPENTMFFTGHVFYFAISWFILWILYKKKIFLKV